jgi:hypothetical protein
MRGTLAILVLLSAGAGEVQQFTLRPQPGRAERACHRDADCQIVPRTCCGTCKVEGADDLWAIRRKDAQAYVDPCATLPCPACVTALDPAVRAVCSKGECTVAKAPDGGGPPRAWR